MESSRYSVRECQKAFLLRDKRREKGFGCMWDKGRDDRSHGIPPVPKPSIFKLIVGYPLYEHSHAHLFVLKMIS